MGHCRPVKSVLKCCQKRPSLNWDTGSECHHHSPWGRSETGKPTLLHSGCSNGWPQSKLLQLHTSPPATQTDRHKHNQGSFPSKGNGKYNSKQLYSCLLYMNLVRLQNPNTPKCNLGFFFTVELGQNLKVQPLCESRTFQILSWITMPNILVEKYRTSSTPKTTMSYFTFSCLHVFNKQDTTCK